MYEIGITAQFEAAHRLVGDFGPATRTHGHTYRLDVVVRGPQLQADGTLYDIAALQSTVNGITGDLHYRDLNDVAGLEDANTTAETVAHYCWERVATTLHTTALTTLRVQVWENPQAYAAREDTLA